MTGRTSGRGMLSGVDSAQQGTTKSSASPANALDLLFDDSILLPDFFVSCDRRTPGHGAINSAAALTAGAIYSRSRRLLTC
ncbi:hypothetical protein [Bradyrhizobium sp.]|uniref:hypothetical protein n=1 Tax=Bradyrhizobium sp. TaxID=376 RepID=UPI0025BA6AEC|nr:hypothetical protein [Bradyrhizobium sp.]